MYANDPKEKKEVFPARQFWDVGVDGNVCGDCHRTGSVVCRVEK